MKKNIRKLCLLIASSDFTENQLRDVFEWIDDNGVRALENAVSRIRLAAEDAIVFGSTNMDKDNKGYYKYDVNNTSEQLDRLLRLEAGLSASQASNRIMDILHNNNKYYNMYLPKYGKQGFRKWIEQLSGIVPYSELLHIATKIRNTILHGSEIDWPLKNQK